ncbi:MAG: hypothetical protein U1D33_00250, partial [bacterium]|nr:hypothetical protein [bacterium]
MTKILIFGFLILQACGHSQVNFPGSQDAVPVTASAENISKASALREYDSLALKPSSKNFVSPLTKTWQAAFQKETGLNAKEISQLYQSAALDPVFRLSKEEPR